MRATEKIDAIGPKVLAGAIGCDLVTVYRWRRQLNDGDGISDKNKRKLIDASAGTEHAIALADFYADAREPGSLPAGASA